MTEPRPSETPSTVGSAPVQAPGSGPAPTGAVLVIGGGIAGIQAALDLADSGFKVYLAESSPAIGGNMARLDKTFPTNDCSMCILSPKLVEAARHRNIELLTLADVDKLEGEPGRFTVRLRQRARFVDPAKCTGCGLCLENCPTFNQPRFDVEEAPPAVEPAHRALVDRLLAEHGSDAHALIRIMQDLNAELRYLPRGALEYLARAAAVPVSRLFRIGSFYKAFSFEPRGRHTISVCEGTACHIRGAPRLVAELTRELGVAVGRTTADQRFTLETVRCLGCCSLAPVVKIDDKIYGGVKPADIPKMLKDFPA